MRNFKESNSLSIHGSKCNVVGYIWRAYSSVVQT